MKKLPDDAFSVYLAMGVRRSHQAVADRFGVDKKTVTNRAMKEGWKQRIDDHERAERERLERNAAESVATMNDRHLKLISFIQGRAIETLKAVPLDTAINAVKALSIAIDKERVIRGEPTQRSTIDLERKLRDEHDRWYAPEEPVKAEEPSVPEASTASGDPFEPETPATPVPESVDRGDAPETEAAQ